MYMHDIFIHTHALPHIPRHTHAYLHTISHTHTVQTDRHTHTHPNMFGVHPFWDVTQMLIWGGFG